MNVTWKDFLKQAASPERYKLSMDSEKNAQYVSVPGHIESSDSQLEPWQREDKYSRQYPDDPKYTASIRNARSRNIADAMSMAGDFHDRIQVPTKREFAGVPGKDYDAANWQPGFRPRAMADRLDDLSGTAAVASRDKSGNPWVTFNDRFGFTDNGYLNADQLYPWAAHEVNHLESVDAMPGSGGRITGDPREGSGRSEKEREILDDAYRFDKEFWKFIGGDDKKGVNSANAEQGGTNTQYRANIDAELTMRLGRKPTYKEFKDFIKGMSYDDILDRYKRYANGYVKMDMLKDDNIREEASNMIRNGMSEKDVQDALWKKYDPIKKDTERAEAIRKAWLEVARNRFRNSGRNRLFA